MKSLSILLPLYISFTCGFSYPDTVMISTFQRISQHRGSGSLSCSVLCATNENCAGYVVSSALLKCTFITDGYVPEACSASTGKQACYRKHQQNHEQTTEAGVTLVTTELTTAEVAVTQGITTTLPIGCVESIRQAPAVVPGVLVRFHGTGTEVYSSIPDIIADNQVSGPTSPQNLYVNFPGDIKDMYTVPNVLPLAIVVLHGKCGYVY